MAIYNLKKKVNIWWQDTKKVKRIKEHYVTWKTFKKYFKRNDLLEQYYEQKAKEFCELRLGGVTMKKLCSKLLSLLRYVPDIIDEKPKIQRFLNFLPLMFKERIKYDNPKNFGRGNEKRKFLL